MILKKLTNNVPSGNLLQIQDGETYDKSEFCVYNTSRSPDPINDLTKGWESVDHLVDGNVWRQDWKLVDIEFDSEEERQSAIEESVKMEWSSVRSSRDYELGRTDWMSFGDSPEMPEEVALYRQELRDITNTSSDPFTIVFPENPLDLP